MSTTRCIKQRRPLADLKHDLRALLGYYWVGMETKDDDVLRHARIEIESIEREIMRLRHPSLGS